MTKYLRQTFCRLTIERLRTERNGNKAVAISSVHEPDVYRVYNINRECDLAGKRYLICQGCKKVYRTELFVNGRWQLAFRVRYQHLPDCKTHTRAEVIALQAELLRMDMVKEGMTAAAAHSRVRNWPLLANKCYGNTVILENKLIYI